MAPTLSTSSFSSLLIYFFPVTWQEKVIHLYSDFSLYYFFFNYFFGFHVFPLSFPSGSTLHPPILGVHSHPATTSSEGRTAPHPGASGFTSCQSRSGTLGVRRPDSQCSFYTVSGCSWLRPIQSPRLRSSGARRT